MVSSFLNSNNLVLFLSLESTFYIDSNLGGCHQKGSLLYYLSCPKSVRHCYFIQVFEKTREKEGFHNNCSLVIMQVET